MWHTLLRRAAAQFGIISLASVVLCLGSSAFAQKAANPTVTMVIAKRGTITLELLPTAAPKTVAHFLDLVNKKFYDGIIFHRYAAGFVVQAGDPKSKEMDGAKIANIAPEEVSQVYPHMGEGGSGKTVPLEAKVPHERGTLGLARSQQPDSGDSQFFLNLKDNHSLDAGYCVFGKVTKGLEVMDAIRQGDKITSVRLAAKAKPKK